MEAVIRLDVAAAMSAFPTVRMVLGGAAARLDFSLEEIDDLYLAAEELFRGVIEADGAERILLTMGLDESALRLEVGGLSSPELRSLLQPREQGEACLDLCRVLAGTVDEVILSDGEQGYSVMLRKSRKAPV
jgi:hypothetical protein